MRASPCAHTPAGATTSDRPRPLRPPPPPGNLPGMPESYREHVCHFTKIVDPGDRNGATPFVNSRSSPAQLPARPSNKLKLKVAMFSVCPFCHNNVLPAELERHANNHFLEDDFEKDMQLAKQISLELPNSRGMCFSFTRCGLASHRCGFFFSSRGLLLSDLSRDLLFCFLVVVRCGLSHPLAAASCRLVRSSSNFFSPDALFLLSLLVARTGLLFWLSTRCCRLILLSVADLVLYPLLLRDLLLAEGLLLYPLAASPAVRQRPPCLWPPYVFLSTRQSAASPLLLQLLLRGLPLPLDAICLAAGSSRSLFAVTSRCDFALPHRLLLAIVPLPMIAHSTSQSLLYDITYFELQIQQLQGMIDHSSNSVVSIFSGVFSCLAHSLSWILDSGASHHITSRHPSRYLDSVHSKSFTVASGDIIPVSGSADIHITPSITLCFVLHVLGSPSTFSLLVVSLKILIAK
ncbi:hypothetical protein KSP39_PZI011293 [Platanthera zijinensis]|uniref:Uncharacterized protein n=1 Tax=Platanthera zijinensis TaxID=2320716 RepID=A0AAP0G629_9ASPA